MKIVYCIHSLSNSGGMERMISDKANRLAERGHDIVILTTEQHGKPVFFNLHPAVRHVDLGIDYSYSESSFFPKVACEFFMKRRRHAKSLRDFLMAEKADIVISTFGNELKLLPSINDGSKKIAEIHFSRYFKQQEDRHGIWKLVAGLRSRSDVSTIKKFDRFVVLTATDRTHWPELHNVKVIANFTPKTSAVSPLDSKCAIAAGRLSYQKGFDDMIEVWRMVSEKRPDWKLRIFGTGPEKARLEEKIKSMGLDGKVQLQPATSKIFDEYLKSSLFIMTSRYEGLPVVLLEAMNHGLPAVAMDCLCGPKDVINEGKDGFVIYNRDKEEMARRILQLIDSPEMLKEFGREAHRHIDTDYTPDVIMREWEDFFRELTDDSSRSIGGEPRR